MAVTIVNVNTTTFSINGIEYLKNFMSIVETDNVKILNVYDSNVVLQKPTNYVDYTVDGSGFASAILLQSALKDVLFRRITDDIRETVIVAEGQSNMGGADVNIIAHDVVINPNVLIWNGTDWEILDPTNYSQADSIYFHFARKHQETYGGIVKVVINIQGGTAIADWIQTGIVDRHQDLIDDLAAASIDKVDIHLWHQGESDASSPTYIFDLEERIRLLETLPQYDTDEFVFLFGEMMEKAVTDAYDIVRATMLTYENVISRKNIAMVRSKGLVSVLAGVAIDVHFDGLDLYKFGQRYFEVFQNMSIGQNLQTDKTHTITATDSDDWDLTANIFITTASTPSIILIPRTEYNKKYTIINTRTPHVNLNSYNADIDSNIIPYQIPKNLSIEIQGVNDNDTIDYHKINSVSPERLVWNVSSSFTLSGLYHNSIIRLTAAATITIPTDLPKDFRCTFDVEVGDLTFATSGTTLTKIGGFTVAATNDFVDLYRRSTALEDYRAKLY